MGRKSLKELRQKEIIKEFYKIAKQSGLENASIAKTAAAMSINASLIMHYFQTKEQLIYGLVEYILDKYLLIFSLDNDEKEDVRQRLEKAIDNIFSKKWNKLFDDGVSYSCYSLTFRDKSVRKKYKLLLDTLRKHLEQLITACCEEGLLDVEDPSGTADLIFILADGAYYYLSLTDSKEEYNSRLESYKKQALGLLKFNESAVSLRSSS